MEARPGLVNQKIHHLKSVPISRSLRAPGTKAEGGYSKTHGTTGFYLCFAASEE